MPFIGERDGERLVPAQVSDGETVHCLSCGDVMTARGPFADGTARHFHHINQRGSCSEGESNEHRKMKSLAVSELQSRFDGQYERCGPEVRLNVSHTASKADHRRADALVEFTDDNPVFGTGLIIEVQYRNKGKQIPTTTKDYLECGYSVYGASAQDCTTTEFQYERLEDGFQSDSNFAYSPKKSESVGEFSERDLLWEDPVPDCDHLWEMVDEGEFCARCRINRIYSKSRTRYLYDNMGLLGPLDRPEISQPSPKVEKKNVKPDSEESEYFDSQIEPILHPGEVWPQSVPKKCPHYNGPVHRWTDFGWADQGTAQCLNCKETVEKDRLPNSVMIEDFY